jgi:hypothetical protein
MLDIFSTKPDFINEQGSKFWLDKSSTNYAKTKKLKNIQVLLAENKKGDKTRIITENGKPIYDSQLLENIGMRIDLLAMLKKKGKSK